MTLEFVRKWMSAALIAVLVSALGCSEETPGPGGGTEEDPDAAPDDPPDPPDPGVEEMIAMVPLSPTGHDSFFGMAFEASGKFYAVGFIADGVDPASDRSMVLARFLPSGQLDTTFDGDGLAIKNVTPGGRNGEVGRGITIQSTGKIVIAGTIEHDVAATGTAAGDRDLALVRFNTDGSVDPSFGDAGVMILDLETGVETTGPNGPTWSAADAVWNLTHDSTDRLYVHGAQRAPEVGRTDTDYVAVRLSADGAVDSTFSGDGKFTLDLQQVNASARSGLVVSGGKFLGTGYANTPGLGSTQPVVYRLDAAGELDTTFGNGGVFHEVVLGAATEVYGISEFNGQYITAGYGRNTTAEETDWVSLRLNGDGTLDPSWGDAGAARVDLAGYGDNCRGNVVLSDGRVLLFGGGRPTMDNANAMVALLDSSGQLDLSMAASGMKTYDLGGASDQFWGGAVSPDGSRVIFVGTKGTGNAGTIENNDDAAILIMPMP